jgi:hypothetical protein
MPVPMSGERANFLDVIALARRTYVADVPGPHTPELIDSYNPIVRADWQARAARRGMGCDLLFPTSGNALVLATRICGQCPVLEECRTTALDDPSLYGVWARTSVAASSRESRVN